MYQTSTRVYFLSNYGDDWSIMGKLKRKRAATVLAKKKQKLEGQELNPFEVRVNRKKHHVLGQRSKSDRGLPGVSRSKAILKVICAPVKTLLLNIHSFALFFCVCVVFYFYSARGPCCWSTSSATSQTGLSTGGLESTMKSSRLKRK